MRKQDAIDAALALDDKRPLCQCGDLEPRKGDPGHTDITESLGACANCGVVAAWATTVVADIAARDAETDRKAAAYAAQEAIEVASRAKRGEGTKVVAPARESVAPEVEVVR